jgi:hypothetical protein
MPAKSVKAAYLSGVLTASLFVIGCVIFSATAIGARVWGGRTSQLAAPFGSSPPIPTAQAPTPEPRGQAQIVHFTLYDVGIFPSEARANPGLVAIYIDDLSGDTQGLVIERESGQRLGQVTRPQNRSRGRARIALGRGVYRVYDAGRPANRARLIVEP